MICKRCGGGVLRFVDELKCISCGKVYGMVELASLSRPKSLWSEQERRYMNADV